MYRILSDVLCMLSKLMNLQVAKIYGDNGTFYGDIKYTNSSHEAFHN